MRGGSIDPDSRLGTTVAGKYQLVRVLGTGGMGAVYEAVHEFTARHVALKLMHARYAASTEAATRFLRESRAPSTIGHPALVDVLDGGREDDGSLYMTLELLEGEDLATAMRAGRVDPAIAVAIAMQLLDALGAAHARGFVHRDIKPANVFLTRDARGGLRMRLLDFGIARKASRSITEGLTAQGAILGTPDYMSPEQGRGDTVDGRADLWSLGAMLFHVLTGRPPFEAANVQVLIATLCNVPAPSLRTLRPDLPAPLIEAVDRALQNDLRARWPDAAAMAACLSTAQPLLGAQPAIASWHRSAPTISASRADPPPARRGPSRRLAAIAGLVTVTLLVAAGGAVLRRTPAAPMHVLRASVAPPIGPIAPPAAVTAPFVIVADAPQPEADLVFVPIETPAVRVPSAPRVRRPVTRPVVVGVEPDSGRRHALQPVRGYD